MQYAVTHIKDKSVLLDAKEARLLDIFYKEKLMPAVVEFNDNESKKTVVYGAILYNRGTESFDHQKWLNFAFAYPCIDNFKILSFIDIQVHRKMKRGALSFSPFAALVETDDQLRITKSSGVTAFLYYNNLDILTNVINRECIYAIKGIENKYKPGENDWVNFVNEEKMIKIATSIR